MTQQVLHPMVKMQRKVQSLVKSNVLKPTDSIWKIAFLYEDKWPSWKKELEEFDFSMQDPVSHILAVKNWED